MDAETKLHAAGPCLLYRRLLKCATFQFKDIRVKSVKTNTCYIFILFLKINFKSSIIFLFFNNFIIKQNHTKYIEVCGCNVTGAWLLLQGDKHSHRVVACDRCYHQATKHWQLLTTWRSAEVKQQDIDRRDIFGASNSPAVLWVHLIRHEHKVSLFQLLEGFTTHKRTFIPNTSCLLEPSSHASHLRHRASRLPSWPPPHDFMRPPLTPCWPCTACWPDLQQQRSQEYVWVKAKSVLIITRATLTSPVSAGGLMCVYAVWFLLTLWLWSAINLQH